MSYFEFVPDELIVILYSYINTLEDVINLSECLYTVKEKFYINDNGTCYNIHNIKNDKIFIPYDISFYKYHIRVYISSLISDKFYQVYIDRAQILSHDGCIFCNDDKDHFFYVIMNYFEFKYIKKVHEIVHSSMELHYDLAKNLKDAQDEIVNVRSLLLRLGNLLCPK